MSNMIKCSGCGAEIDKNVDKCPYCEEINYIGAEKKYMGELDEIKDSLADLGSESLKEARSEISDAMKSIKITLSIIAIVILVTGGIFFISYKSKTDEDIITTSSDNDKYKEAVIWIADNEANLNKLYEEERYDEILAIEEQAGGYNNAGLTYWKHYEFMEYYKLYADYKYFDRDEKIAEKNLSNMLYEVVSLQTVNQVSYKYISEIEKEKIAGWGQETSEFYGKYLGITDEEEIEEIIKTVSYKDDHYYVNSSDCRTYIEELTR